MYDWVGVYVYVSGVTNLKVVLTSQAASDRDPLRSFLAVSDSTTPLIKKTHDAQRVKYEP